MTGMAAGAADGGAAAPAPGGLSWASLFPLPLVNVPRAPSTSRGAGVAQRRDREVARRANEVVRGFTGLPGTAPLTPTSGPRWCRAWPEFMRRPRSGSGRPWPAEILKSSRAPSRKRLLRFSKVAPSTPTGPTPRPWHPTERGPCRCRTPPRARPTWRTWSTPRAGITCGTSSACCGLMMMSPRKRLATVPSRPTGTPS